MFQPDSLSPDEQAELDALLSMLTEGEDVDWLSGMTAYQRDAWRTVVDEHSQFTLLQWGRRCGKTYFGSRAVVDICNRFSGCEILLMAPVYADIRDVMLYGNGGLMSAFPEHQKPRFIKSENRVEFINGNYALLLPASEGERPRGKTAHFIWADELGSWKDNGAYQNARIALSATFPDGSPPQLLVTTTPQPSTLMKAVAANTQFKTLRAATFDNPYLHPDVLQALVDEYGGTTAGRQELYGELLDDVAGALWTVDQITPIVLDTHPVAEFKWIAIGVDPSGDGKNSDLCGIVVVGLTTDNRFIVLGDHTGRYSPQQLHDKLCQLYGSVEDGGYDADGMWVESNYGGSFLRDSLPKHIPTEFKPSTKSKAKRAAPVVMQYEKGLVNHAPGLADLEREMYTWSELDKSAKSPNRLDAMVFAYSWLLQKAKRRVRVWC